MLGLAEHEDEERHHHEATSDPEESGQKPDAEAGGYQEGDLFETHESNRVAATTNIRTPKAIFNEPSLDIDITLAPKGAPTIAPDARRAA